MEMERWLEVILPSSPLRLVDADRASPCAPACMNMVRKNLESTTAMYTLADHPPAVTSACHQLVTAGFQCSWLPNLLSGSTWAISFS